MRVGPVQKGMSALGQKQTVALRQRIDNDIAKQGHAAVEREPPNQREMHLHFCRTHLRERRGFKWLQTQL